MTKFVTMKVRVPVDDDLPVQAVVKHSQAMLEARDTEIICYPVSPTIPPADPPQPVARTGRIHWPAAEVVQAVERPPAPAKPGRRA